MGAGQDYFDALEPDYTIEVAEIIPTSDVDLEGTRRLLFMLKKSLNGDAMSLYDNTDPDNTETVAISPEFTDLFGYNLTEFKALSAADFFHPDDLFIAEIHAGNNLGSYYSARCKSKAGPYIPCYILGSSVKLDTLTWRTIIFEQIP